MVINRWSDGMDSPNNEPIYCGNTSKEIWTTREEQHILVGNMTDAHVKNCYNMVMSTNSSLWQQIFRKELEKRGLVNEKA